MNINDITITSLETINAFDIVTGAFVHSGRAAECNYRSDSSGKTDITGKQGRKLNSLKKNKAVTISGTNGLVSAVCSKCRLAASLRTRRIPRLSGTIISPLAGNAASTAYKAVGTTGNEVESVYVKNSDGTPR